VHRDYHELLSVLCAEKVDFMIVGAFALATHGFPRFTGDLDIWVRPSRDNAERVWKALARFGAPLSAMKLEDFQNPAIVFRMGFPPSQVDILPGISGLTFEDAWQNRVEGTVEEVAVPIIAPRDMIKNKRAAGRPKDFVDADLLEKHYPPS
jgi:hypothetical protein